ncbi:MAG TPA: TetR/AcrR family transcriptional regulator [Gemmatimonadales bacterium]|nr:TetR/AcrR family transcriptional regulator [Gemmatimonadales bacterium]
MDDIRDRILQATARIYAEAGFRGATTRRVAQEAGVNEITLFRHFGTKEALVKAALRASGQHPAPPVELNDPEADLTAWALATYQHWHDNRQLITQLMSDLGEHPELAPDITEAPREEHAGISRYLERMRESGLTRTPFQADAAAGLLLGAVFAHAMWRDHFARPDMPPVENVIHEFVRLLLGAIGVRSGKTGPGSAA